MTGSGGGGGGVEEDEEGRLTRGVCWGKRLGGCIGSGKEGKAHREVERCDRKMWVCSGSDSPVEGMEDAEERRCEI